MSKRFGYWYGLDLGALKKARCGSKMIFEIEYMYIAELKERLPECTCIYIWPDKIEHAIKRLHERQTGEKDVDQRLQQLNDELNFVAEDQVSEPPYFDYHFVNDYTPLATSKFSKLIDVIENS